MKARVLTLIGVIGVNIGLACQATITAGPVPGVTVAVLILGWLFAWQRGWLTRDAVYTSLFCQFLALELVMVLLSTR